MSEWIERTIADAAEILDSMRIPVSEEVRAENPGDTPYYGANGLQGYISGHIFDEPLVLIAEDGGYFEEYANRPIAYRIAGKSWVNNHAHILRAKPGTDFDYLFFSLQHKNITPFIKGGTRAKLNKAELQTIQICLPQSVSRQKKIAAILTAADSAIEKTEALIAKYQQIKAGLMHDLFTRGVLPNGQLRSSCDVAETPFGKMPAQWHLGSLLELTDPQRQPILTGPFGADLGNADFVAEGVPVLRIGNVQQGRLELDDLLHVSTRKAATLSRYQIREGDLLFARQGATTGRNALADSRVEGCLINYHIIRVALDHKRCSPLFVEAAFANEIVVRQIERDKGRGTREGINTNQLTSLSFPIAPLEEQRLISKILSRHNRFLQSTEAALQKLRIRKLGLMQDLLTGKVPVRVDEVEAADV